MKELADECESYKKTKTKEDERVIERAESQPNTETLGSNQGVSVSRRSGQGDGGATRHKTRT